MTLFKRVSTLYNLTKHGQHKLGGQPLIVALNGIQTRQLHWKKISNKRITRLESDIELDDCKEYKSRLINRNPRNLEQLCFERKPVGFFLEKSAPTTWNILSIENTGKYLNATLKHWSGRNLVEASTNEEQLAKYFTSPTSTQAAIILAQVIARRCLQSGYLYAGMGAESVANPDNIDENLSSKEKAFYDTVKENGFSLNEPPEITPRSISDV